MNELWDVYTLTNIAGIAVSFSALSLLLIWLFSGILQRTQKWHRASQVARSDPDSLNRFTVRDGDEHYCITGRSDVFYP